MAAVSTKKKEYHKTVQLNGDKFKTFFLQLVLEHLPLLFISNPLPRE
jgi:hypothetical protein